MKQKRMVNPLKKHKTHFSIIRYRLQSNLSLFNDSDRNNACEIYHWESRITLALREG